MQSNYTLSSLDALSDICTSRLDGNITMLFDNYCTSCDKFVESNDKNISTLRVKISTVPKSSFITRVFELPVSIMHIPGLKYLYIENNIPNGSHIGLYIDAEFEIKKTCIKQVVLIGFGEQSGVYKIE